MDKDKFIHAFLQTLECCVCMQVKLVFVYPDPCLHSVCRECWIMMKKRSLEHDIPVKCFIRSDQDTTNLYAAAVELPPEMTCPKCRKPTKEHGVDVNSLFAKEADFSQLMKQALLVKSYLAEEKQEWKDATKEKVLELFKQLSGTTAHTRTLEGNIRCPVSDAKMDVDEFSCPGEPIEKTLGLSFSEFVNMHLSLCKCLTCCPFCDNILPLSCLEFHLITYHFSSQRPGESRLCSFISRSGQQWITKSVDNSTAMALVQQVGSEQVQKMVRFSRVTG